MKFLLETMLLGVRWFANQFFSLDRKLTAIVERHPVVHFPIDETEVAHLWLAMKIYDRELRFHGVYAESEEEARRVVWPLPGSLYKLENMQNLGNRLLTEALERKAENA